MVKISGCFRYNSYFVMLCDEIGWHDSQNRQVSGKFADYAVEFANWLANLAVGRLDRTYTLTGVWIDPTNPLPLIWY